MLEKIWIVSWNLIKVLAFSIAKALEAGPRASDSLQSVTADRHGDPPDRRSKERSHNASPISLPQHEEGGGGEGQVNGKDGLSPHPPGSISPPPQRFQR